MSSRRQIIQTTSTTEPVGAALGDEWFEPTSGRLYKRMLSGGTVGWTEIQLGQANTITNLAVTGSINLDNTVIRDTATATTTSASQIELVSANTTLYGSMGIVIQATQGTERHITKLTVAANSSNAISTEYSTLITNVSLFTVDTDLNAGNMRVLITPASSTSTTFKASYELITA